MLVRIRTIASVGIPALGALISLLWYWKRRNRNMLDYPKPPDKDVSEQPSTDQPAHTSEGSTEAQHDSDCPAEGKASPSEDQEPVVVPPVVEDAILPKQEHSVESSLIINTNSSEDAYLENPCKSSDTSEKVLDTADTLHSDSPELDIVPCTENVELSTQYTSTTITQPTQTLHSVISQPVSSAPLSEMPDNSIQSNSISSPPPPPSPQCELSQSNAQISETKSNLDWAENVEQCNMQTHSTAEQSVIAHSTDPNDSLVGCLKPDQNDKTESKPAHPGKQDISNMSVDVQKLSDQNKQMTPEPGSQVECVEEEVSKSMNNNQSGSDLVITKSSISSESPRSSSSNGSSENGSCDHDVQSVMSADSGLGSCVPVVPLSAVPVTVIPNPSAVLYEFDFPTEFCGQLIGKFGRNINRIKDNTGIEISVNKKPYTQDFQVISLEGSQSQIDLALSMIRDKFPVKRYPTITLEPSQQEALVLQPEMMQLSLPEGVSVEALVSSVVAPNHVFLQQPTHPTFHMLERLNQCMNMCYAQENMVPELPRPIEVGMICAAPMYNTGWYRAQVVESYPDRDEVDIKFVDYGGYMTIQGSLLRQIRSDFSVLPFQAVECYMANVMPPKGLDIFPAECVAVMEQLVQGKLLQAQVVGHEENGIPYVQLYELQGDKTIFVNRELVNSGAAQWIEHLL